MKRTMFFAAGLLLTVGKCVAANADDAQVNEAAAVFDGVKPSEMRGGTWKVVYSSAEGPQGRALETLTERLGPYFLREGHLATALVLPLEKDGGEAVKGKRDMIVVGIPSENAMLRKYLGCGAMGASRPTGMTLPEIPEKFRDRDSDWRDICVLAFPTPLGDECGALRTTRPTAR